MYNPYDNEKYPNRKNPRLNGYDYSTANYYFVTVCTDGKVCLFGNPGEENPCRIIAEHGALKIPEHYPGVTVDKMVVMPNHVHMVLILDGTTATLDKIVGSYKAYVTKEIHKIQPGIVVWQKSFHDHIIRNEEGYRNIWSYIDSNPQNWDKDCFYTE